MTTKANNNHELSVTQRAAENISAQLLARGKGVGIRIGITTTGCSGLAYTLEYADASAEHDIVITDKGVTIMVDPKSMVYMKGTVIDYTIEGLNSGFKFTNPNSKAECGCGESFTV
jgi:iron-sulfur cluster assembly protein